MRYYLLNLILAFGFSGSLTAASADTWQQALSLAKTEEKDILLFVHGSDWNRLGEKFRNLIWEQDEFRAPLDDRFVLLRVDYLESPDDAQKKIFDEAIKGIKLKFRSYPVLAFYDSQGNPCGNWIGSDLPVVSSEALSLVSHMGAQRKKSDALLAEAKQAKGSDKAEFLYLAVECDAGMRGELVKQLKDCDSENESGYLSLLEFDGRKALGRANQLAGEKKYEEALAWLDGQMNQGSLETEQKQWILAAKGNVYRRWGDHLNEMGEAFSAAYALDPNSVVGKACGRFAKRFSGPPSLEFGWDSRHCDEKLTQWTVDVDGVMNDPGDYEITLQYKRGKSALSIEAVALFDGDQLISEDRHQGSTARNSKDHVYRVSVAKSAANPSLRIDCHSDATKNSQGLIEVKRLGE